MPPIPPRCTLVAILLTATAATVGTPTPNTARAADGAPLERWQRLLDAGRFEDAADQATRWLARNAGHSDESAATAIIAEADWRILQRKPTLDATRLYRAKWPTSPHRDEALNLEASLSLYRVAESPTEVGYRDVVDRYPGTPAAAEAHGRAEGLAWQRVQGSVEASAFADFIATYPGGAHSSDAQQRWRELAWAQAEAADSVEAWVRLRAEDPQHPRLAEAAAREQRAALASLGSDATPEALLKAARRYDGTDAGWTAWTRVLDGASLRLDLADGSNQVVALTTTAALSLPHGLRGAEILLPGPAPKSMAGTLSVWWPGAGDATLAPWPDVAAVLAGRWSLPPLEVGGASDGQRWSTPLPICQHNRGAQGEIRYVARGPEAQWRAFGVPFAVERGCGGPEPMTLVRDSVGVVRFWSGARVVDQVGGGAARRPVTVDALGMAWTCDGAARRDERGLWLGCSGWEVLPARDGFALRPPAKTGVVIAATGPLPQGTDEQKTAVPTPPEQWFGAPATCAHPKPAAQPTVPDLVRAPPGPPAWVAPGFQALADEGRDLDGDGGPERILLLAGRADARNWIVVQPFADTEAGWALPYTEPFSGGPIPVSWDGCQMRLGTPTP